MIIVRTEVNKQYRRLYVEIASDDMQNACDIWLGKEFEEQLQSEEAAKEFFVPEETVAPLIYQSEKPEFLYTEYWYSLNPKEREDKVMTFINKKGLEPLIKKMLCE